MAAAAVERGGDGDDAKVDVQLEEQDHQADEVYTEQLHSHSQVSVSSPFYAPLLLLAEIPASISFLVHEDDCDAVHSPDSSDPDKPVSHL